MNDEVKATWGALYYVLIVMVCIFLATSCMPQPAYADKAKPRLFTVEEVIKIQQEAFDEGAANMLDVLSSDMPVCKLPTV